MSNELKTTYNGVEIVYDEQENKFKFEFRGRERAVESLSNAKKMIDSPEPGEKPAFTKTPAWLMEYYSGDPKKVEVTAIAEKGCYDRGINLWIRFDDAKRRKTSLNSVFLFNPRNTAIVEEIIRTGKAIEELSKKRADLKALMEKFELPKIE